MGTKICFSGNLKIGKTVEMIILTSEWYVKYNVKLIKESYYKNFLERRNFS